MHTVIQALENKLAKLSLSDEDKKELSAILKTVQKAAKKSDFKIKSALEREKVNKRLMISALKEMEDDKNQIQKTNNELLGLNKNLTAVNALITEKNAIIEKSNKKMLASINYAKRIQEALLTSKTLINKYLPRHFLLYKPKETVSGDFYYISKVGNKLILAVADCTGHGVSGAFLSILGITYLHEITHNPKILDSASVLTNLRRQIKKIFGTFGSENKNGLDIVLCTIDYRTNILEYAGAYSPLWIVRNKKLLEYKATKSPIGFFVKEKNFSNTQIKLYEDDLIYLFSDGFRDQLGGQLDRPFTKNSFQNLLLKIHTQPLDEQKKVLEKELKNWQNGNLQTDDITILALKFKPELNFRNKLQ